MSTAWKQTVAPATEPITTAEGRTHLRVTHNDDDTYIDDLIVAARNYVEAYTGRQLITATWTYKLNDFPYGRVLSLPVSPLISVTSVQYEDTNGSTQTFASGSYDVDTDSETPRIVLAPTADWPQTEVDRANAVTVTFTAGYGAASDVPDANKRAMYLLIGHWYEHREAVVLGGSPKSIPFGVNELLDTEKAIKVY